MVRKITDIWCNLNFWLKLRCAGYQHRKSVHRPFAHQPRGHYQHVIEKRQFRHWPFRVGLRISIQSEVLKDFWPMKWRPLKVLLLRSCKKKWGYHNAIFFTVSQWKCWLVTIICDISATAFVNCKKMCDSTDVPASSFDPRWYGTIHKIIHTLRPTLSILKGKNAPIRR